MRIALLSDGIPPYIVGGMQKHSFLLAEYLAMAGVEVELFHYIEGSYRPEDSEVLEHFRPNARGRIRLHTFNYKDSGRLPGHYLRAQKKISEEYFDALKPLENLDFILIKGFVGWATLKGKAKLSSHCKTGIKFHGMNMFQIQPNFSGELSKHLLRPKVKWAMGNSDFVFSYGGRITDIIERAGVKRNRIIEITSGISEDWINNHSPSLNDERVILFVGRYDRVKGLPELYDAARSLGAHQLKLRIVGPIPEEQRINESYISYTGSIEDPQDLMREYDKADALICPSISEGMPNVILEGMAPGLYIIASDVGATSMMIDGNGSLIQLGNANELKNALETFLTMDSEVAIAAKNRSLELIKTFTWEKIVERFIRFFQSNLSEH